MAVDCFLDNRFCYIHYGNEYHNYYDSANLKYFHNFPIDRFEL